MKVLLNTLVIFLFFSNQSAADAVLAIRGIVTHINGKEVKIKNKKREYLINLKDYGSRLDDLLKAEAQLKDHEYFIPLKAIQVARMIAGDSK